MIQMIKNSFQNIYEQELGVSSLNKNISCPFHEDKKPSMRIALSGKYQGRFKCFSCGASGDVIDFVAKNRGIAVHGIEFTTLIKELTTHGGV